MKDVKDNDARRDDALMRAVERRSSGGRLPSNFVFATMAAVQRKAEELERRRDRRWFVAVCLTSMLMLGAGIGALWACGGLQWLMESLRGTVQDTGQEMESYRSWPLLLTMAGAVAVLLVVDHVWLRRLMGRGVRRR